MATRILTTVSARRLVVDATPTVGAASEPT